MSEDRFKVPAKANHGKLMIEAYPHADTVFMNRLYSRMRRLIARYYENKTLSESSEARQGC